MNGDRVNKKRFWELLEKKASGNANSKELAELDEIIIHSWEAKITAALLVQLWQCRSIDEIERLIQQELAEGHDGHYIWPE